MIAVRALALIVAAVAAASFVGCALLDARRGTEGEEGEGEEGEGEGEGEGPLPLCELEPAGPCTCEGEALDVFCESPRDEGCLCVFDAEQGVFSANCEDGNTDCVIFADSGCRSAACICEDTAGNGGCVCGGGTCTGALPDDRVRSNGADAGCRGDCRCSFDDCAANGPTLLDVDNRSCLTDEDCRLGASSTEILVRGSVCATDDECAEADACVTTTGGPTDTPAPDNRCLREAPCLPPQVATERVATDGESVSVCGLALAAGYVCDPAQNSTCQFRP